MDILFLNGTDLAGLYIYFLDVCYVIDYIPLLSDDVLLLCTLLLLGPEIICTQE